MVEVPHLQRLVVGGGDGEAAIRRHRHAVHRVGMPFEGAERLARGRGPTPSASYRRRRRRRSGHPASPPRAFTQSVCPSRVRSAWPVARSHTFSVLSPEAETAKRPSGVTATPCTESVCPSRVRSSLPGGEVPHLQRLIVGGGDGDAAIRRHRHAVTPVGMPFEGAEQPARWRGPTPSASYRRRRRRRAAVAAHRHGRDPAGMPFEGAERLPVARSHTFSVLSSEPETASVPSALTATALTPVGMAFEGAEQPARWRGPTPSASYRRSRRRPACRRRSPPRP